MKKLALLTLLLAMTGCAIQRFDLHPASQDAAAFDDSQTFWVGGIGQKEEIDAAKVCGGARKVQRVETQMTAGNVGLAVLTIGIYSPRQVRVYCNR
jgi:hypothetical protein